MKKFIFFSLFLLMAHLGFSQVGVSAGIQFFQATEWEKHLQEKYNDSNISIFDPNIYAGVDYWFRLKNKRIEFLPELSFSRYESQVMVERASNLERTETYKSNFYSFFLNTNIYPLDFAGDCNCPTFNKDGDLIKKGFFFRIAPGVSFNSRIQEIASTGSGSPTSSSYNDETVNFQMRAGVGLDIGVTPFFTITPLVMGTYTLAAPWHSNVIDLPEGFLPITVESDIIQFFAGIRLGFRFDELNKYGYR